MSTLSTTKESTKTNALQIEDESLAGSQEAVPVPLFFGKRKIALRWIMPAKGRIAIEAQDVRTAKK